MRIKDLINEYGFGDIAALLDDAEQALRRASSAHASIYDYINQVGLKFRLYENDQTSCMLFYGLTTNGGESRAAVDGRFRKKIMAAAITKAPSYRPGPGAPSLTYDRAKEILRSNAVGPRGISILTNKNYWTIVGIEHGSIKWHKKT
jgi:hypothetical protein